MEILLVLLFMLLCVFVVFIVWMSQSILQGAVTANTSFLHTAHSLYYTLWSYKLLLFVWLLPGGRGGRCIGRQTYHLHLPNVYTFWESQPPGTTSACTDMFRNFFTFTCPAHPFLLPVLTSIDFAMRTSSYRLCSFFGSCFTNHISNFLGYFSQRV